MNDIEKKKLLNGRRDVGAGILLTEEEARAFAEHQRQCRELPQDTADPPLPELVFEGLRRHYRFLAAENAVQSCINAGIPEELVPQIVQTVVASFDRTNDELRRRQIKQAL